MKKLVYILPEASKVTHMKYNVEFLESLSKDKNIEIFLILERGVQVNKDDIGVKYLRYTGNTNHFSRILLMNFYLLQAFLKGYRKVYIHYSFVGAFFASLNPFFTTYYWNCGIPMDYKRPFFQEIYETVVYKIITHFVTGANVLTSRYANYYKFNNSKSIVIPNWIDVSHVQKIILNSDVDTLKKELNIQNQKVLFFNQRLAERKGAHYIPEILSRVSRDYVLLITNDGPYKEELILKLKEKQLFNNVRILGRVPNEKVLQILSITDLYILPSQEEGMSHSLMEAMAANVAAVSFNVGGTFDMYPDQFKKYVVKEKDVDRFSEVVNDLLSDDVQRKELGNSLFEKVKTFDLSVVLLNFKSAILYG